MKFAKKSLSVLLATVMAMSSLFVSTTAFAAKAQKTFVPTAAQNQTFTVSPIVKSDKSAWAEKEEDKYQGEYSGCYSYWDSTTEKSMYCYYNEYSYYSFVPAQTGTYDVTISGTTSIYRNNYDDKTTYTTAPAADAKSVSVSANAYVEIFDKADVENYNNEICYVSQSRYPTSFKYDKEDNEIVADVATAKTISYRSVDLVAGETYYIKAYAPSRFEYPETYQGEPNMKVTATAPVLNITKSDWSTGIYRSNVDDKTVRINVDTTSSTVYDDDYDEYLTVKTDATGAKYVEKKIYTPVADVKYVGSGAVVNVPTQIAGADVKCVNGTKNKNITSLNIPAGVDEVYGFSGLRKLASVNLGTVKEIGSFYNCSALTSINIPATVKSIDSSSFRNCTSLSSVTLNEGLESVGDYAFYNTALKCVNVPASVKTIGTFAFGAYSGLDEDTVQPNDTTDLIVPGFIMAGKSATAAQKYALQNGIAFYDISAGCPHPYNVTTVAATIFAKGSKTSVCPICGAVETKAIAKKKLKISSLKAAKKAVTVKVAKHSEAKGYQIQVSTSKKFTKKTTKTVKVKTSKALNKKITGLKSGKKYYVRVRAYKTSGKKTVYSSYSAVKSVKVK